jgi:hypothetical protein
MLNQAMRVHFCGDELTGFSLFLGNEDSEGCECEEFGNTDCCMDLVIKAEVSNPQIPLKNIELPVKKSISVVLFHYYTFNDLMGNIVLNGHYFEFKPPPQPTNDLSLFQVFRL